MDLKMRVLLLMVAAPLALGLVLFVPAGTLDYWQAWLYMGVLMLPAFFVSLYFLKNDPAFLERRLRTREKEAAQSLIIRAATVVFIIAFIIPGLDRRFGWSSVPHELVFAADAAVFVGYALVFFVFRENSYAGRTIEVEKGQKVISSGPYSVIRHPMYLGTTVIYIATPIALGSYVAVPVFLLLVPIFILRILNEEKVLRRDLPGYAEYCRRTRYRLVPYFW